MNGDWFDRLEKAVLADGRDMKALSLAAGLGQNYVQQMLKDRKEPRIGTFVKLLGVLGRSSAIYIITGSEFSPIDQQLFEAAATLDEKGKQHLIAAFAAMRAASPERDRPS